MSIFDVILERAGYQRRLPLPGGAARKELTPPYIWPTWREGQPDWTSSTMLGYAEAGYGRNAVAYACLARLAGSAAYAPIVAYTGERDAPQRVPDGDSLAALLLRPNGFQSWYEFSETLILYAYLDGNAFILKARNGQRPTAPVESLYPLRPDRVRPVPKDRTLLGYVYDPLDTGGRGQNAEVYLPSDIIHIRLPNPTDPFEGMGRGTSPLGACAQAVDVDNSATSFLKAFFDNAVVPFGLLKSKQKLVDAEVVRIRARLKEQYGGVLNWGEVMILDADAEYQRLGLSMQEMTFGDLDSRNEARICAVLGVPAMLVGVKVGLEHSTYCLPADTRVWTNMGSKSITEIRPGDKIWSYENDQLQVKNVLCAKQTGHKALYEVRTKNRILRATGNHPVLCRVPGLMGGGPNSERHAGLTWKRVDQLSVSDHIVQIKALPDQEGNKLPDGSLANTDLLQFLGAIIGDGTVSPGIGVRMAFPPEDRCYAYYHALAEKLFTKQGHASGGDRAIQEVVIRKPVLVTSHERDFGFCSAADSRWLDELGFGGRAHTKRIPGWVYGLSRALRLAFVAGLVDSDGSVDKRGSLSIGLCSKVLTQDIRDLLIGLGLQCSNLDHQIMKPDTLPQPGKQEAYHSWRLVVSSARQVAEIPFADELYRERVTANQKRHRSSGADAENAGLPSELGFFKVRSIKALGAQDVFDIEVEGGHSFVAEGVVVHNSNMGEARKSFWEDSLIPNVYRRFEDGFSNGLSDDFPGHWLAYDYSQVPALREDEIGKRTSAVEVFKGGLLYRNEARALLGLEPVEDELDILIDPSQPAASPFGVQSTGESDTDVFTQEGAEDATDEALLDDETDLEDEKRRPFAAAGKATREQQEREARLRKLETRWARELTQALARQRRRIFAGLTRATVNQADARIVAGDPGVKAALRGLLREVAVLGAKTGMAQAEAIMGIGKGVAVAASSTPLMKAINVGFSWELVNDRAVDWAENHTTDLIGTLTQTQRDTVRKATARWIRTGDPLKTLIAELDPIFGPGKARTIAVTETTAAYAQGNMAAWKASGVIQGRRWETANDERVCFPGFTQVLTADGWRAIQDIHPEMRVMTRQGLRRVIGTSWQRYIGAMVTVVHEHGLVTATFKHPFWTQRLGWLEARLLDEDCALLLSDGSTSRICSTQYYASDVPEGLSVYNLEVEEAPEFYANGVLVHNCPICAPLGGLAFGNVAQPASITQQQAEAQVATLDTPFVHPGGGGAAADFQGKTFDAPPAHVRCRCGLSPLPFMPTTREPAMPITMPVGPLPAEAARTRLKEIERLHEEGRVNWKDRYQALDERATYWRRLSTDDMQLPEVRREAWDKVKELWDKMAELRIAQTDWEDNVRKTLFNAVRVDTPANFKVKLISKLGAERKAAVTEGVEAFKSLVGIKLPEDALVEFKAAGRGRASYGLANNVNLTTSAGSKTVVHELGHWYEDLLPDVHEKALAFYDRRTAGEALEHLGTGYRAGEMTRKDKFLYPYMGKEYISTVSGRYATEIVSMGTEMMYSEPARLAREDPDMFDFVFNLLRGL